MSEPPLLELDRATKTFRVASLFGGDRVVHAIRDVSFRLDQGEALALVGESGSGKSTCARAIVRLFGLTSGRILFRGRDIAGFRGADVKGYARSVQMVFQDPFAALNPTHTVRHHLTRPLKLHGHARGDTDAEVRRILTEVELDPDETIAKYPHELSGGERQRVNLARVLAVGAELIVADEPASMLDMSIRRSVLDLMLRLKTERGITFLYITHDIATASYFAERIAVMFAGRIVEAGPSAEIVRNPQHPYSRLLLSALPEPGKRLAAAGESAREFTQRAEAVRRLSRGGTAELSEHAPGHFVRPMVEPPPADVAGP
jgi:peptide/nickel transport system ATP-binding protein